MLDIQYIHTLCDEVGECPKAMLGRKFSVITDLTREISWVERDVRRFGLEAKFASARAPGIAVLELQSNFDATLQSLIQESKKAIEEDGAETICLGCAGMAGYDEAVEEATGVPVLDGVVCAVKFAEAMFDYKKTISKVSAYQKPEPKPLTNLPSEFEVTE